MEVKLYKPDIPLSCPIPWVTSDVEAGFPSPADDYIDQKLDLHSLIVKRPAATFFVRVQGESMIDAGIHAGDILVVDRSIEPSSGKIVVAVINGDFTVKKFEKTARGIYLVPGNPKFEPIPITGDTDFQIWGTVTYVIHKTA